jgi:uncharacterized protein (DUF1501 family)
MKRKSFIKKSLPVAMLPVLINGFNLKGYSKSPLLRLLGKNVAHPDRVFVVIQLNGGNDGLNTVIPLDQYSNLSKARNNILINESKVLKITGTSATGLHPAMTGLRSMYDEGLVSIVQSAGYPDPNFSHFRATDIWLSGSDSNQYLNDGWAGRFLAEEYPNFPTNYPNQTMPDPPAIQIGSSVSPMVQGPALSMGMAISDPSNFYQLIEGIVDTAPSTPAGKELTYVRLVAQQTMQYADSIKAAAAKATNKSTLYPSNNKLADQLKIVAQLVAGGLKTKIYIVNLGGFDTHASQTDGTATETGDHATLLKRLSDAIFAFQDDLKLLKVDDKVAGMTFSEFGRRIASNASLGTDHGAAAPMIVFGKLVNPGIVGTNPIIASQVGNADNVPMQYDYRQIYASVLADWFGADATEVLDILSKKYDTLPIFKTSSSAVGMVSGVTELLNYPNPCNGLTTFKITTAKAGHIQIKLFDTLGKENETIIDQFLAPGTYEVPFKTDGLPKGNYYYVLHNGAGRMARTLMKN